jgi:hypothetical protein
MPEPAYVDLIAESLREVCERQGGAAWPLIARVIDQHIAGSLQSRRVGRWRDEALDGLLSLISPAMQSRIRQQAARNGSADPRCGHRPTARRATFALPNRRSPTL